MVTYYGGYKLRLSSLDCIFQTAEMPDFYADGEYDLSGFAVGVVKKDSVIDGKTIVPGDVLIGLPSSGVHSNGFSLVRRLVIVTFISSMSMVKSAVGSFLAFLTSMYVKISADRYWHVFTGFCPKVAFL